MLPPVMNVWIWLFWKVSIFLRYLHGMSIGTSFYRADAEVFTSLCYSIGHPLPRPERNVQ